MMMLSIYHHHGSTTPSSNVPVVTKADTQQSWLLSGEASHCQGPAMFQEWPSAVSMQFRPVAQLTVYMPD
uniref:Uncharacterized protein n=1 Tax=Arundo donax TaxID=35708 RepID=A0A0A8YSF3_ARUDO